MADDETVWEADETSLGQDLAGNGGGSGSAALPEEWGELFDGASGSPYWRSPLDGTVSWVKPTAPAPTSVAGPAASPAGSVDDRWSDITANGEPVHHPCHHLIHLRRISLYITVPQPRTPFCPNRTTLKWLVWYGMVWYGMVS